MKNKFSLNVLFVSAVIMSSALAGNVLARSESSCASGEITGAYAPASSASVVINEIYGNSEDTNSVYNADFIELYNLSDSAVNISDYSVQYYTAGQINAGAPTHTAHIPAGVTLAAKSYYVIRISPIRATGAPLPCAALDDSATFAETGIAADSGKLVLSSTGADLADCTQSLNVVDRVAWGTTPVTCNETTNANTPFGIASIQRRAGAADTDNNSADFTSFAAPTPCGQLFSPTAAVVNVGGRVTNSSNNPIAGIIISITDSSGSVIKATTDSSGYYSFAEVTAGATYIITAASKRFTFAQPTQVVNVSDDSANINFTANPTSRVKDLRQVF